MIERISKEFPKKTIYIDLEDALKYPSPQIICKSIEKYCTGSKQELEFVNMSAPIIFSLDGTLYDAKVEMAHGGYYIHCKEV